MLSFPVHSMGWIELEESEVAPHNMSETIAECITTLAQKRKDLWNTAETWGEVNTVHSCNTMHKPTEAHINLR